MEENETGPCLCCGKEFTAEITEWGTLSLELCFNCCSMRCDAYPGQHPRKD